MLKASFTTQFKRDLKRAKKRGKDSDKIKAVMSKLIDEVALEENYRDNELSRSIIAAREE